MASLIQSYPMISRSTPVLKLLRGVPVLSSVLVPVSAEAAKVQISYPFKGTGYLTPKGSAKFLDSYPYTSPTETVTVYLYGIYEDGDLVMVFSIAHYTTPTPHYGLEFGSQTGVAPISPGGLDAYYNGVKVATVHPSTVVFISG